MMRLVSAIVLSWACAAPVAAGGLDACFADPVRDSVDPGCDGTCRLHRIAAPLAECAFAVVVECAAGPEAEACLVTAVGEPDATDLPPRSEVEALLEPGHGPSERLVAFAYDDDRPCGIPEGAMDVALRDELCQAYPTLETRVAAEAIRRWWAGEAVR